MLDLRKGLLQLLKSGGKGIRKSKSPKRAESSLNEEAVRLALCLALVIPFSGWGTLPQHLDTSPWKTS